MNIVPLKEILRELNIPILHSKSDGWMTAMCPFAPWTHAKGVDTKPSFFVRADNRKRSGYNCYACHMRGNVSSMIMGLAHHRRKNYSKLVLKAEMAELETGIGWKFDEVDAPDDFDEPLNEDTLIGMFTPAWEAPESREYLKQRRIREGTTRLLGLMYDKSTKRILFPVRNRDRKLYGYSGRSILTEEALRNAPNKMQGKVRDLFGLQKSRHLLGADRVDGVNPIYLVEGLFAYAAAFEEGVDQFANPVASMGSVLSQVQADMLVDWGLPVYCFYDNDEAGQRGIYGGKTQSGYTVKGIAHNLASEVRVFVPDWPEGLSDPDEVSKAGVRHMMSGAKLLTPKR